MIRLLWQFALQQIRQSGKRLIHKVAVRGHSGRLLVIGIGDLVPCVLILMTVNAQQLPVGAVRGIVVIVVVFVVNGEFPQTLAAELAAAPAADMGEKLEGAPPIGVFTILLDAARIGNNMIDTSFAAVV